MKMYDEYVLGLYAGNDLTDKIAAHYSGLKSPDCFESGKNVRDESVGFAFRHRGKETHMIITKVLPRTGSGQAVIIRGVGPNPEVVQWMLDDLVAGLGLEKEEAGPEYRRQLNMADLMMPLT